MVYIRGVDFPLLPDTPTRSIVILKIPCASSAFIDSGRAVADSGVLLLPADTSTKHIVILDIPCAGSAFAGGC